MQKPSTQAHTGHKRLYLQFGADLLSCSLAFLCNLQ